MATQSSGKGRSKKQIQVLRDYFGDLPIREAKSNLLVIPRAEDVAEAVPGDATSCAVAKTCERAYGSKAVVFFRAKAYVDLPDDKGGRVLQRFILPKPLREAIKEFDKTGKFPLNGFTLIAPTKGQTLRAGRGYSRDKRVKAAKTTKPRQKKTVNSRKDAWALDGVRSGTGQIDRARASA